MPLSCEVCHDRSMAFDMHVTFVSLNKGTYLVQSRCPTHEISGPLTFNRCIIVPWQMYVHDRPWQQRYSNFLIHSWSNKNAFLAPPPFLNPKWSCDSHVTHIAGFIFTYLWHIRKYISILLSKNALIMFCMYFHCFLFWYESSTCRALQELHKLT